MNNRRHTMSGPGAVRFTRRKGSALLLVLLCVAILSFAVIQHIALVNQELQEAGFRTAQFRCQQLAESGISIAMLPGISNGDPALEQTPYPNEAIKIQIRSESAKLNINMMLKSGKTEVLENLFQLWRVPPTEAKRAVDALYSWTHPADAPLLPSASNSDAPPQPMMMRSFATVGDMAMLPEMEPVRKANPEWAAAFTIWGPGQLDLNEATPDLIAALCDIPFSQAARFVEKRNGSDRLPYTPDDTQYTRLDAALSDLSLPPSSSSSTASTPIQNFLTITASYRRIISTGSVFQTHRTVEAITRLSQTTSAVMEWAER